MIITNENLDRIEFNNHLETIGLNNILSNLNKGSIIKRIVYDPLQLDKDKIQKNFLRFTAKSVYFRPTLFPITQKNIFQFYLYLLAMDHTQFF